MEPGNIVEFIDSQKIICAVVTNIKKLRLRLLTENNREVKLTASRLSHHCDRLLDTNASRLKLIEELKSIVSQRHALSETISIHDLWEVLNSEQEWIDLPTMTALCFTDNPTCDHESAVVRALFNDRLYFKFDTGRFFPNSPDKVEQIIKQRESAARKERFIVQGAQWMQKVLSGQSVSPPVQGDDICDKLASYYLHDKESPDRDIARAILKKAGGGSPSAIFSFLTQTGRWQPDENLDILRYGVTPDFPAKIETHAQTVGNSTARIADGRRDLRQLDMMTIDGPSTMDFDDAISIHQEDDHFVLGVHIADVGHYVTKNDPIDQVAYERCSTIYMPDGKIPMLPANLSDGACSLKAGQERPAISTLIHLNAKAEVLHFEIVPSIICVKQQLTFQDVDSMAVDHPSIKIIYDIAKKYRQYRAGNGALLMDLPEINVWINPEGRPMVAKVDRESPGRMMVAEIMIFANELTARLLTEKGLPAIFRSQAEPRERLFNNQGGTLFQNWMQRKLINRFLLNSTPERHAGLGLPGYVTATSPIRKYYDLITQRQLRALSGLEKPYSEKEIDTIISACEETMTQVGRMQYRRQRYWLLKHLQQECIGQKEEALVLYKRREGYMILLQKYMLECRLSGADNITLRPEDLAQVTIQHVNARNDILTIILG